MGRSKETVLGIDIGGSKILAIYGKKTWRFKTPKNKDAFLRILKKLPHAQRIGIGFPGRISGTKVLEAGNLKYLEGFDFSKLKLGSIKIENDAQAFLRAEMKRRKERRIIGITIGTGIGRAYAEDGKIKKVAIFQRPELGEGQYVRIRDSKKYDELAKFLGLELGKIIRKLRPDVVILGGGLMDKKGFFEKLKKELKVITVRSKFGNKAGAIGAAMLWN